MLGVRSWVALAAAGILLLSLGAILYSQETYEDYRDVRDKYNRRDYRSGGGEKKDRPLSELSSSEREDLLDELRGAVRDEIDESMSRERRASKKKIDKEKLITDVKRVVREEIEDAIKIKEKRYLSFGTIEVGGFVAFQTRGLESDERDINYIFQLFPLFNYFVHPNIAISVKAEANFNLTSNTQLFNVNVGPSFVFGINKSDSICFYASIYNGISMDTAKNTNIGYRFSNEVGLKFVLTSGVILNLGVMVVFDNNGEQVTGFSNLFVPSLGITAWF